ncbi:MAG: sensor histidine kinase [Lawsonibacter sp.]|nr:sensor histidine kinase [Lawsonibacter sp.]
MDYFSLCMDGLCLVGQSVMHIGFAGRLTGKKPPLGCFAAYLCLLGAAASLSARLSLNGILSVGLGVLALYGVCRLALGNRRPVSWLAAVLAFYISQLSFGVINSVEAAVFPRYLGNPLLYLLLAAAMAVFFLLCAGCYAAVLKLLSLAEDRRTPYLGLLLLPGLFFFAAELYILHSAYSFFAPSLSLEEAGKHSALLLLQGMGLAALLCTLYAYRHLCQGFQAQAQLSSLAQAARAQKVYITEARARYEQTRAFRHDIKNHLSVLDGLLGGGELDQCRAYLRKLEAASEALSFPYQTGNPVVDILLGEKLGLAGEIAAEVSLCLPRSWEIDDFDLCVIFANALDNAIAACRSAPGARFIRIAGKRQGDFYLLTFENACSGEPLPPAGTGLSNIKSAAEKYRGAVLTEKTGQVFSLNVLLNIA